MKIEDIWIQFYRETGDLTPMEGRPTKYGVATEKAYIIWLQDKLLEEWNKKN